MLFLAQASRGQGCQGAQRGGHQRSNAGMALQGVHRLRNWEDDGRRRRAKVRSRRCDERTAKNKIIDIIFGPFHTEFSALCYPTRACRHAVLYLVPMHIGY